MKKVFSLLLMSLIMVGCDFLPTPSSNSVSTSNSSINSSLTITSSESLSSSDIKKEELQLLSFKAIDDNNASIMKMQKDNEDVQEVVLDEGQNTIFVEAIVRNESRYSFVDMVIYLSFLDTYVVFNEGNGNYICSTTTILENDMWVTKINFEVNVDFSESYYGYVEVNEITFFDLNSLKVNTNLNKVKSKKINYHKHYGESFKTIEPTCSMQGYDEYTCEYCGDKYKNNYVEINENNHSFIDGVCEYCDYKDYSFYVPKAPEGYIGLDINYHYVGKEIDDSIVKKDTYNLSYSDNINTFDYLATKNIINHKYTTNFVDGLIEHTPEGDLAPALAYGLFYSEDYTKLRIELRNNVKWVDNNMSFYSYVTADDFATSLQHLLDAKSGAENLAYYIKGAKAYADGTDTNFRNVGFVKISDYEFEYIFEKPTPFFHTLLTSSAFKPLNRKFFEEMGGQLGEGWDPKDCGFGTTTRPQSLLYCGPYVFTAHNKGASLSMAKNLEYWDKDNVHIEKVKFIYNSGVDANSLVEMFKDGELDTLDLNGNLYELIESEFGEEYIYEQGSGTTTYYFNWNLNRQTYEVNDCVSGKTTDAQKENTRKAILNENFRKAIFSAIPKIELNALATDSDLAINNIRNTYTTPEFVSIGSSIESDTGVTHDAGSQYYEMVNKEMKALNEKNGDDYAKYVSSYAKKGGKESSSAKTEENLSTFNDKEDSYFNEETALVLAKKAKAELEKEGVTFPVHIDYLCYTAASSLLAQAELLRIKVEKTLNNACEFIEINIQGTSNLNNYETSHFLAPTGADMNFDLSSGTGWAPEYGDPATFLHTLSWEGNLYNNLGFDSKPEDEAIYYEVLGDYQALYEDAQNNVSNVDVRYAKFAAAEAELLNSAVIMPNTSNGGGNYINREVPNTRQKTLYGCDMYRFKYVVLSTTPLPINKE